MSMQMTSFKHLVRDLAQLGFCGGLLLAGIPEARGGVNAPEARFRGAPTYDFGVTNVKWEAATKDYSYVTFDLSWSFSWRARWTEPAATSATGKDLEIENWDAAWVFIKFLPEKDKAASRERNHWQHATLDTDAAHHLMPAGATNMVGLSFDPSTQLGAGGSRGLGVFIYRNAIGHGRNDFKGVKLRWLHPPTPRPQESRGSGVTSAGKFDPAKAAVNVHAIPMVYIPEGPFHVGGIDDGSIEPFLPGPTVPVVNGGGGVIVDGSWHGGPFIPFLVDGEWNCPASSAAASSRARRVGPFPGQIWGTLLYGERMAGGASVGQAGVLNDEFPTGYDAFYCMKYPLTQGLYADFLNSLPPDVAAERAFVSGDSWDPENAGGKVIEVKLDTGRGRKPRILKEQDGFTIYVANGAAEETPSVSDAAGRIEEPPQADGVDALVDDLMLDLRDKKEKDAEIATKNRPPVYAARLPFRRANYLSSRDYFSYAVWAGLRPMSELEYEKLYRGPLRDVSIVPKDRSSYPLLDEGLPTERYAKGVRPGSFASRVGSSADANSDRDSSGATYWGMQDFSHTQVVPLTSGRGFRGSPGDGRTPEGTPGASVERSHGPIFDTAPADWPPNRSCGTKTGVSRVWVSGEHMGDARKSNNCGWFVRTVKPRIRSDASPSRRDATSKPESKPEQPASSPAETVPVRADTVRIANVKWEAGTNDASTISFDLAWDNSWRAAWTEPAEKNVTGKPLKLESWDAAWVFVKFRAADAGEDGHATLALAVGDHHVPAGAALEVGPNDAYERGVGVFIYRSAAGRGPTDFKDIKLRWLHGADGVDPGKVELKVHAIEMVYIPGGPFKSKSPWGYPLTLIETGDATTPGGYATTNTNEIPLYAAWPNGYKAFYFMKHAISQGHYTELLNSMTSNRNGNRYGAVTYWSRAARYESRLYGVNGFSIKYSPGEGTYQADFPDRVCNMLSWPDMLSYTAWAGLRLPTDLEYEKSCRGPREVARAEDAWTPETCRPTAGLGSFDGTPAFAEATAGKQGRPDVPVWTNGNYGASYWGIYGLSLSGNILEWAGVFNRCSSYSGSQGSGTPWAPADWPWCGFGDCVSRGQWFGMQKVGIWADPFQMNRIYRAWEQVDADRTGRFGVRTARTAPVKVDPNAPLKMQRLPSLVGHDIVLFTLSGTFRHNGDEPMSVKVVVPMPDACFPGGAASRTFTAAPKTVTPFKILTMLTRDSAAEVLSRGPALPVRIETSAGEPLAEASVRVLMSKPRDSKPPVILSFDGGALALSMLNATDRPQTITIDLPPPPGVKMTPTQRRLELAAGAQGTASFSIPRQGFAQAGVCRMPYRVTVAEGAPLSGETAADIRSQSRWWIFLRVQKGLDLDAAAHVAGGGLDALDVGDILEMDRPSGVPADMFKRAKPPKGWQQQVADVSSVPIESLDPLPSQGSGAVAAIRVTSPADREAVLSVGHQPKSIGNKGTTARFPRLFLRVWLNDKVVHESRSGDEDRGKPTKKAIESQVHLAKGENTLLVECRSDDKVAVGPGTVSLEFLDPKGGKRLSDLMFDMEQKK